MSSTASYGFAEPFQQRIVALCLRDPAFLLDHSDVVDPNYFDHDYLSSIVKVVTTFVSKYNEIPAQETLIEEIRRFCEMYRIDGSDLQTMVDKIGYIYRIEMTDTEAVRQNVIRFGKHQAMKAAIIEAADIVDNFDEHDKILETIMRATRVGDNVGQRGLLMYGSFSKLHEMNAFKRIHDENNKVPTMFPTLDHALVGGRGPSRGEVWVIMGLPGRGKSQFLVNIGCNALHDNVPVIHITIADLDEIDVGIRYAARLTGHAMDDVLRNADSYKRASSKLDQFIEKYLRIKYWASYQATIGTIRGYLSRLVTEDNIKPGVIIVDYPDELKPTTDNDYQNMGHIYSELNLIAHEYNAIVWVASQVRRWQPAKGKEHNDVIRMDNIADSWRKAAKADGIISWNQTYVEKQFNSGRLYVDKVRRGRSMFPIEIRAMMDCCYMREKTQQEIAEETELIIAAQREEDGKKQRKGNGVSTSQDIGEGLAGA